MQLRREVLGLLSVVDRSRTSPVLTLSGIGTGACSPSNAIRAEIGHRSSHQTTHCIRLAAKRNVARYEKSQPWSSE